MTISAERLADAVMELPKRDREFLLERLVESLEAKEVQDSWIREAKTRRDEVRSGKVKPVAASEVYSRIDKILGR
jgi:putative addiction module component (TIGR02574 family)